MDGGASALDPAKSGPHAVGTVRMAVSAPGGRLLPVQLWYPAADSARSEAAVGHPVSELEPAGARRDTLASLFEAADEGCVTRTAQVAFDAPLATGSGDLPLVLFSHCHQCTRFSQLGVAERLASHGFVVAAPDHVGNTLFEGLEGSSVALTADFLAVRAADVRAVLDVLLEGTAPTPIELRGRLDAGRVGMFGHSFGSVTTGLVMQEDPRVKAGAFLAAPPENPLLPGVSLARLTQPALFLLAEEDNSITALGNQLIVSNFETYPAPATLVSVKDAGHWSFSAIAGLAPFLMPGCGVAQRQTDPTATFTYLDNDVGRGIADAYVTAFFASELLSDEGAAAYLRTSVPANVVTVRSRD